jgi:hypothetical protein
MPRFGAITFLANQFVEQEITPSKVKTTPDARPVAPTTQPTISRPIVPAVGFSKAKLVETGARGKIFAKKVESYYGKGRSLRMMLQTDKPLYQMGETIWVRAVEVYLMGNHTYEQTTGASYRLIGPKGNELQKFQVPVYGGHSWYQFDLGKSNMGGEYLVRVKNEQTKATGEIKVQVSSYQAPHIKKKLEFVREGYGAKDRVEATLTLKNNNEQPLADQAFEIQVRLNNKIFRTWQEKTTAKGEALLSFELPAQLETDDGLLTVLVREGGLTESISRPIPLRDKNIQLGFFPEGGKIMQGFEGRVYFAARRVRDQKPQDIEGEIKDQQGNTITQIRSFHDGMGRFSYTPQPGKRYLLFLNKPQGISQTFTLPAATAHGVNLQLIDDFDSTKKELEVLVSSNQPRRVALAALQYETLIAHQEYSLKQGSQLLRLPLKESWRGIIRLTIFDTQYRKPLAERLIFRHQHQGLGIKIVADQAVYRPRQTIQLKVKVSTPQGKPLSNARLGMSVVDDTVLSFADDHEPHFLAQRYLSGQLVGKIHKPNFYFKPNEKKASQALDLLMGTHGWRDFDWKQLQKGIAPQAIAALTNTPRSILQQPLVEEQWIHPEPQPSQRYADNLQSPKSGKLPIGATKSASRKKDRDEKIIRIRTKEIRKLLDSSGILALLNAHSDSKNGSLLSAKGIGSDDYDGIGGWFGHEVHTVPGSGGPRLRSRNWSISRYGIGLRGGGGGFSGQSPGLGRLGTYGRGSGRGGFGWGRLYGKRSPSADVATGTSVVFGSLDKEVIRRIIRRNLSQVRYCYEKELIENPRIQGKISVYFVIGGNGRVSTSKIKQTTMKNERVENCLVRRIRFWHFPAPLGGGVVHVSYPFIFKPSDGRYQGHARYVASKRQHWINWAYPRRFPVRFYKGGESFAGIRDDFRETLYWNPHLVTDALGEATVRFGLNDKITSFRVRVAGVGNGYLGMGEQVIQSKRDFYLSVKIPLEVSEGDAVVLPLTLRNNSKNTLTIEVSSQFSPLFRLEENPLPSKIHLSSQEARTYFYPVRVLGRRGEGKVSFYANSQGISDSVERTVKIQPRGYPKFLAWSGTLKGHQKQDFSFQLPTKFSDLQGIFTLYSSPVQSMAKAMASMLREPYGCFEQTSSSNHPNVMIVSYLKTRNLNNPGLYQRASRMLDSGYRRLLSFESKTGGFDWFGAPNGNVPLTAYALLQFSEMRKVYPKVSLDLLERTRDWILARRDGNGGYHESQRSSGYFGSTNRHITDGYITYALTESGIKGLHKEIKSLQQQALTTQDPYLLALALNATITLQGRQAPIATTLFDKLLPLQKEDGRFEGLSHSFTNSSGINLHVETSALCILAMLRGGIAVVPLQKAVQWILAQRSYYGGFGTTQATVLALKALTAFEDFQPTKPSVGEITLDVNGEKAFSRLYNPDLMDGISFGELRRYLRPGTNKIEVLLKAKGTSPFSLGVRYHTREPLPSQDVAVALKTTLEKNQVKMGDVVRLSATIENTTDKALPMVLARLAFPGALETQLWQLTQWKEQKKLDFYETKPREVIVYLRSMAPKEKKQIYFDLVARVTGNYTGAASSAYLYYTNDKKDWTSPLRLSISP